VGRYRYQTNTLPLPRLALFGALAWAIILLAACGGLPAASGAAPTPTGARATATPLPPTSVTVLRFGGSSDETHVAPFQMTAQDATSVQHLYEAVHALPHDPHRIGCPNNLGIGYELSFMRGDTLVLEVLLTGGCPTAKLLNSSNCRAWTPAFTAQIAATLGVAETTLEPPNGLVNTASPNGPFAPFGPIPSVPLPIHC
jgi:hypothetical protein